VSLLMVEAPEAEQKVSLGRELLDEGWPVPEVGHRHMMSGVAVVVLRVFLGAAAGVVVVIVVEQVGRDDAVQVARISVELGKLHLECRSADTESHCALRPREMQTGAANGARLHSLE